MKLTVKNTKGKKVKIKDAMGRNIPYAFSYDTVTKRAGIYLPTIINNIVTCITGRKNGKGYTVKVNVVIPGSYAEIDGKRIK